MADLAYGEAYTMNKTQAGFRLVMTYKQGAASAAKPDCGIPPDRSCASG